MILHVYPHKGFVISNSSLASMAMGNQLPPNVRIFTLPVPVNVPMIYKATLQPVMGIEYHAVVYDEIILSIKRTPFSILQYLIWFRHFQARLFPRL